MQLAAREHRLEHVGGVHRAFGGARADDGVQLVDEQDHLTLRVGDLFQDGLQPLLEFAAVLGARDERPHVERDDLLVLEAFRHVLAHDPLREPLDDRRLADAGIADEHRVVLGPPRQHLDHASNFFVAPDDGIELALLCQLGQVASVPLERLIRALGILRGDALRAADRGHGLQDGVLGGARLLEHARGGGAAAFSRNRQQQVFGADVLVLETFGFRFGGRRDLTQARGQRGL